MRLYEKIIILRAEKRLSQEEFAEILGVSRQAVAKWESGKSFPSLENLVALATYFGTTVDFLVKDDEHLEPHRLLFKNFSPEFVDFLCKAKQKTYAGHGAEVRSCREGSHDLSYREGKYMYYDTYLGGNCFSGEEAVWYEGNPMWAMNYSGRVLNTLFSGDFLKEALLLVPQEQPYRGPPVYKKGNFLYHSFAQGTLEWFQGYEEIFFCNTKVYECYFHGGIIQ
ncbi:MAG: DUF5680 domain-containing protein [Treponemataceae bacterium]|nr:DUF5680 domain-containing protein [Treponemataceae bacterium]